MKDLINIEKSIIGEVEVNSVNSRDIYTTLEIKQEFANWIKKQINSLGLEENVDYVLLDMKVKQTGSGGHNKKEYIITLETAKHIAMASRTPKGKEIRNYFIEIEKEFLNLNCNSELKPNLDYKAGKVAHVLHSNPNSNQDPQFMKIVKELYGAKATRKYFAPILGIEYEEQEVIMDENEPDVEIKSFVSECIEFDSNSFISSKVLYKTYIQWCERQGVVDVLSHRHFTLAFNETTKLTSKQQRFNGDRIRGYDIGLKD